MYMQNQKSKCICKVLNKDYNIFLVNFCNGRTFKQIYFQFLVSIGSDISFYMTKLKFLIYSVYSFGLMMKSCSFKLLQYISSYIIYHTNVKIIQNHHIIDNI